MKTIITSFSPSDYRLVCLFSSLFISALVSYLSYPVIIKISRIKQLMQEPGSRSSHFVKTPNLGGIGIFLGITTVLTLIGGILSFNNLPCFIGALIILFFTGLKDDLIELSPINKLMGQLLAALFVIIITDVRIHSFFGIFGIYNLPYLFSVAFTLFVFILLINAYNLIDGVDGLAASVAITSSMLFAVFFYNLGNTLLLMISLSLIGTLITFLVFNFSKTKKVFMGDTGSMIIGFLMAYQAINYLNLYSAGAEVNTSSPPLIVLAIFSYPLMDTLRVFIIRIQQKRSPFSADKNHLHHNLLSLGFKHWQIALIASIYVLSIFGLTFTCINVNLHIALFSLILFNACTSAIPYLALQFRKTTIRTCNEKQRDNNSLRKFANQIFSIFL